MDGRMRELKRLKRKCQRAKRRLVTGWKTAAVLMLVLALLSTPAFLLLAAFNNAVSARTDIPLWRLTGSDDKAVYYAPEAVDETLTERMQMQLQAESVTLMMNTDSALPLDSGTKVRCFWEMPAAPEAVKELEDALTQCGFQVGAEPGTSYTAVVVLARAAGEALDLRAEEASRLQRLADLKAAGAVDKIVVLLHTAQAMQLDFLKGNPYKVDGVLWTGAASVKTVAAILAGGSPSGSLVSTHCYDLTAAPKDGGIYTGYKYFQTRYEDFVMGTGNAGDFAYEQEVAYPFGFGLSYTAFAYSDMTATYDETLDRFAVTVTVTNTGERAARETVQLYAQTPYTDYDKQYGVEKAAVALVGFAKTALLEPGSSSTVTIPVDRRALASFDALGAGTYILDAGSYYFTAATDAHNAVNNILAAKGYTPENTEGRMDAYGDGALTYSWEQPELDRKTYAAGQNGAKISGRLTATEGKKLSRQDWVNTLSYTASAEKATPRKYNPADYATVAMPTVGAENGVKLYDLREVAFDDPKWQMLLDQLTVGEMAALIGNGFSMTVPTESVQAPGAGHGCYTALEQQALMAATFDTALLGEAGLLTGSAALAEGDLFLYGFEEILEDSFLTGQSYAAQITALREKGVNAVVKLQLPDSLAGNEQALREGYLEVFRYAFASADTAGALVASADAELLNQILRGEWGSCGVLLTDSRQGDAADILSGVTGYTSLVPYMQKTLLQYENDPVVVSAMRIACHYTLYALVNSAAMNGIGPDTEVRVSLPWPTALCLCVALVSWVLLVVFAVLWGRGKGQWKKTAAYLDYRTLKNVLKEEKTAE